MKKLLGLFLCAVLLFSLVACGAPANTTTQTEAPTETAATAPAATEPVKAEEQKDIVVLFTNDVHGALTDNIGYPGLVAYKKKALERTPYVVLVDCGDATQGSYLMSVSNGEMAIDAMNYVGYDFAVFGNHEFDRGVEHLSELLEKANAQYLCCNVIYSGSGETPLDYAKPYEVVAYGDVKVGFVGVSTPETISSSSPRHFEEDGKYVYDFGGSSGEELYSRVQKAVDACRAEGADYVITMMHMGVDEVSEPFTSYQIAQNTTGIDAILDAHSHTEIPGRIEQNLLGEDVLIAQTGTKLKNIGQLVISPNGYITIGYVSDYNKKDADAEAYMESLMADAEAMMSEVIGTLDFDLKISDDSGIRMIRSREMALGDLVADAIRAATGADIAFANGGSIRADLSAGEITYADVINVHPYGNMMCMTEVTGQEVLDAMEYFYSIVQEEYVKDGKAYGENGSFGQFSGLTCVVHTDIPTSIEVTEDDMLAGVGETRRVSDVMVLQNGEYVPIDPNATYTFAATNYVLKDGGSGMGILMAGKEMLLNEIAADYQVIADYIISLNNDFSAYRTPQERVIITK